jgi:flagellar hook protein FlgE
MLRSMYAGISGLRGFQSKLDVIGNNIANVNTPGYKKSRIEFADILSQTTAGGTAPNPNAAPPTAGTNPKQIGLGSTVGAIDVIHTQGNLMTTNVPSDLAIQGNGFFMVSPNGDPALDNTRKDFYLTRAGNFQVDAAGNLVNNNGMFVLNSNGKPINLLTSVTGGTPAPTGTDAKVDSYSIGQDGSITVNWSDSTPASGKAVSIDDTEKIAVGYITNPAGLNKVGGNLYSWSPSADVTVGKNSNAMGAFDALAGVAGKAGRGDIVEGELEMSNTDLSEEFTEMIVAQRGFQANSRIITTSDSILQELVDLKRN